MKLTLDVENTVTHRDGKLHLDPFEKDNKLVMVGCLTDKGQEYLFRDNYDGLQALLDEATILIGHNIVHDLMWIWECGFKYDGSVFDTMLGEYVLQRGQKQPLSLEACAERYNLNTKKQDTLKEYFKKGLGVNEIPADELSEYLSADLHATQELSNEIYKKLNSTEYGGLMTTVILTNRVAVTLARIYQRGFTVDITALDSVRKEFEQERKDLRVSLNEQVSKLMGDIRINLNSPEQLSWVIYSRKPHDKAMWANNFEPYMSDSMFRTNIKQHSKVLYKQRASTCVECNGWGEIRKVKKDGTPYANPTKCKNCNGDAHTFTDIVDSVAGLKFNAPNPKWISANGFSTSKTQLELLEGVARQRGMKEAEKFLHDVRRLSAVETY